MKEDVYKILFSNLDGLRAINDLFILFVWSEAWKDFLVKFITVS